MGGPVLQLRRWWVGLREFGAAGAVVVEVDCACWGELSLVGVEDAGAYCSWSCLVELVAVGGVRKELRL